MDAIGVSRYLPMFIYERGRPDRTAYIANPMESYERDLGKFWVPNLKTATWTTKQSVELALEHVRSLGRPIQRIGAELSFLPGDATLLLQSGLPGVDFVDALYPLERLRARKSPEELALLKAASDRVIEAILSVFGNHGPGTTKAELANALKREEIARDLVFEYCLITTGRSHNRAPSDERWEEGEILSLDFGGQLPRLHRRSVPNGNPRRTGHRARRHSR